MLLSSGKPLELKNLLFICIYWCSLYAFLIIETKPLFQIIDIIWNYFLSQWIKNTYGELDFILDRLMHLGLLFILLSIICKLFYGLSIEPNREYIVMLIINVIMKVSIYC